MSLQGDPEAEDPCLDTARLVALASGKLDDQRRGDALAHVDRCPVCAEVMGNLGALSDPGHQVGRYQLRGVVGRGAMGVVYDAWDPELERRVAIKLVRPDRSDPAAHARMTREARALARINHPNVVAVYDVGEHAGEIFVATEFVDGDTLHVWQRTQPRDRVIDAWLQAARGLAAAHAEGIVHRDVKPNNVLVGRDGRVRVGDFGLARPSGTSDVIAAGSETTASSFAGTPAYMAPEQQQGQFDARSDQYAWCVALAEALTGQRPPPDGSVAVTPSTLSRALERGIRARPDQRFPSFDALIDAIAPRPTRRRVAWLAGFGGASAAVIAILVIAARAQEPERECVAGQAELAWSPLERAQISRALAPNVAARIDHWVANWKRAAVDACATADDEVRRRREWCLADQLAQLRQTIAVWTSHSDQPFARIRVAAYELPWLARCNPSELTPVTLDQFALLPSLRARLAYARWVQPRERKAALTRDIRSAALALAHGDELDDAIVRDGIATAKDTRELLRATIARATEHGDRVTAVLATARLLQLSDVSQLTEALALESSARRSITTTDSDPALAARLDLALGDLNKNANRIEEAIAAYERARRALVPSGVDSFDLTTALTSLGGVYLRRDPSHADGTRFLQEGLAMFRRLGVTTLTNVSPTNLDDQIAVALESRELTRALGGDDGNEFSTEVTLGRAYWIKGDLGATLEHMAAAIERAKVVAPTPPELIEANYQVATCLIEQQRPAAALTYARTARDLAATLKLDSDLVIATEVYGRALLEVGKVADAKRELIAADALFVRLKEVSIARSYTRFLLARATIGEQRRDAIELARQARRELTEQLRTLAPDAAFRDHFERRFRLKLAEIDDWLTAHH